MNYVLHYKCFDTRDVVGYLVDSSLVNVRNTSNLERFPRPLGSFCLWDSVGTYALIESMSDVYYNPRIPGWDGWDQFPTRGVDVFLLGYYAGVFTRPARPH